MCKNATLKFLNNLQRFGWRLGLENISMLFSAMGNPHLKFKSVHIAGTNGKGSTAAMLESILRHSGYKTGLFTSPHLMDVTERIKVNATSISTDNLIIYLERIKDKIHAMGCTYFEALSAVAFQYFADEHVDLALIEVGLGGRFDATNVIVPVLSIITDIELDHTGELGRTKREIAAEKAGIIKTSVPCLSGSENQGVNTLFKKTAQEKYAKFYQLNEICTIYPQKMTERFSEFDLNCSGKQFNNLKVRLAGKHQLRNAAIAVASTEVLREQNMIIEEEGIKLGLSNCEWPGRLEKLQDSPKIVVDVAHNPAAIRKLIAALRILHQFTRLIIVIGLLKDKNYKTISKLIASTADFIFVTTPVSDRALCANILWKEISRTSDSSLHCPNNSEAFQSALAYSNKNDLICVTGSHHVVGEFLNFYKNA